MRIEPRQHCGASRARHMKFDYRVKPRAVTRKGDAQMEILARRFGKKIKLPPTIQIKHQILLRWLEDQTEKEAAEVRKDRFEKQPGVGMLKGGAKAGQ
jgi:hypothetical protein